MVHVQDDEVRDELDDARERVQDFFAAALDLTADQLAALGRQQRRSRSRLSTDPDFLHAVCIGAWGPTHAEAARQIQAQARSHAAALVPWPRRAAVATALEEAALAVLSDGDPRKPFTQALCARLMGPWQRATRPPG